VVEDAPMRRFYAAPSHPYSAALLAATPKYTEPETSLRPVPADVIAAARAEVAAHDRGAG
jgi:peptide/nickel transport system ATP-binding protein